MRTHLRILVAAFLVVSLAALVSCGRRPRRLARPLVGELVVTDHPHGRLAGGAHDNGNSLGLVLRHEDEKSENSTIFRCLLEDTEMNCVDVFAEIAE